MDDVTHASGSPGFPEAFVADVLAWLQRGGARVQAIAGLQGTGKSTLVEQLRTMAAQQGRSLVAVSIDDFYLGHGDRQRRGREVHPLCATRGVPGSHDVALACDVLDALRDGREVALPRFDKIDDERLPRAQWPRVGHADLVLLEGWCLQVPPQNDRQLVQPINALERDEDPNGTWRRWSNDALAHDYPALWSRLDRLLFLQGPGFDIVPRWRWQQEQTLQARHPDRKAMTQTQVERFVQFFERVSRQAARILPTVAERTIQLDAVRSPVVRVGGS